MSQSANADFEENFPWVSTFRTQLKRLSLRLSEEEFYKALTKLERLVSEELLTFSPAKPKKARRFCQILKNLISNLKLIEFVGQFITATGKLKESILPALALILSHFISINVIAANSKKLQVSELANDLYSFLKIMLEKEPEYILDAILTSTDPENISPLTFQICNKVLKDKASYSVNSETFFKYLVIAKLTQKREKKTKKIQKILLQATYPDDLPNYLKLNKGIKKIGDEEDLDLVQVANKIKLLHVMKESKSRLTINELQTGLSNQELQQSSISTQDSSLLFFIDVHRSNQENQDEVDFSHSNVENGDEDIEKVMDELEEDLDEMKKVMDEDEIEDAQLKGSRSESESDDEEETAEESNIESDDEEVVKSVNTSANSEEDDKHMRSESDDNASEEESAEEVEGEVDEKKGKNSEMEAEQVQEPEKEKLAKPKIFVNDNDESSDEDKEVPPLVASAHDSDGAEIEAKSELHEEEENQPVVSSSSGVDFLEELEDEPDLNLPEVQSHKSDSDDDDDVSVSSDDTVQLPSKRESLELRDAQMEEDLVKRSSESGLSYAGEVIGFDLPSGERKKDDDDESVSSDDTVQLSSSSLRKGTKSVQSEELVNHEATNGTPPVAKRLTRASKRPSKFQDDSPKKRRVSPRKNSALTEVSPKKTTKKDVVVSNQPESGTIATRTRQKQNMSPSKSSVSPAKALPTPSKEGLTENESQNDHTNGTPLPHSPESVSEADSSTSPNQAEMELNPTAAAAGDTSIVKEGVNVSSPTTSRPTSTTTRSRRSQSSLSSPMTNSPVRGRQRKSVASSPQPVKSVETRPRKSLSEVSKVKVVTLPNIVEELQRLQTEPATENHSTESADNTNGPAMTDTIPLTTGGSRYNLRRRV